jgi:hypothetical protein
LDKLVISAARAKLTAIGDGVDDREDIGELLIWQGHLGELLVPSAIIMT